MIKIIGYNKALLILILCASMVLLFLYNQKMLMPNLQKQERQLRTAQSEISKMTGDMDQLRNSLEKFEKEKLDFERVQKLGFFDLQDRVKADATVSAIQRESRLIAAKYSIKPASTISNQKLRDAGYKILNTDMDFDLEAIEDNDIYKFIYILNYGFPGQIIIKNLDISRPVKVTQPILRKIGGGEAVAVVKASLKVSWQTMVPDETISKTRSASQNGDFR